MIFDNQTPDFYLPGHHTSNFILTGSLDEEPSPFFQQLTESERDFLQINNDHIAVRLRSEPETRFITIF